MNRVIKAHLTFLGCVNNSSVVYYRKSSGQDIKLLPAAANVAKWILENFINLSLMTAEVFTPRECVILVYSFLFV